jgi:hypothetical protein
VSALNQFEVRYGYDSSWLKAALEVYGKTEMKRPDSEKVGRAFANSQVVVSFGATIAYSP